MLAAHCRVTIVLCLHTTPFPTFEIEFETDSKDASSNFVEASVNLYIATKENSIVIQTLQALIPSELNSVKVEINILKVPFAALRKCRSLISEQK